MTYQRLINVLVIACTAIFVGSGGMIAYWLWWPYQPYICPVDCSVPMPVTTKTVRQGEPVQYWIEGVHTTEGVIVSVVTALNDGVVIQFADRKYLTTSGAHKFLVSQIIPAFASPGFYKIVSFTSFGVNPIRSITIKRETAEFQVVAK